MADSLTGSHFFATYFAAQKPFLLLPFVSLHYPTLIRRRGRRKSLHIAFCSSLTSPNLDVISTHEHSDGTVLFRFGDPSEIAKEDELEEPLLGVEEGGRDSEEEFSVVKVLDGDNEREARGQAETVATYADVSESVVTNNKSDDFVEKETGLSEKFLEDSVDEIGSVSPVGFQDESVAEVSSENAEHVEEISENEDGSEASFTPPENSFPSLEVEDEMRGQSSDESFEELDDDKSLLLGSPAAMPKNSDTINTKEFEESKGEGSSQLTENGGDKDCHDDSIRLMENGATLSEIEAADYDNEIVRQAEQISENIDPIMKETTDSAPDGINLGDSETVVDEISPENVSEGINMGDTETVVDEISPENASEGSNLGDTETVVDEISPENVPEGINMGDTETVVDENSPENASGGSNLGDTETVVDEISPENASEASNLGDTETVVDEISPENASEGSNLGDTETVVDEISPENVPEGINMGDTETVVDENRPENASGGSNLGDTETVVDEISPENASEGIDLGNTETFIDEISSENAPDGIDLGNTETVVDEIRSENAPDGIDLGNTETVVDEMSSENSPDVIDLGNAETVVDEISSENAPDVIDLGNTETVVDEIRSENDPDGIDLGNTETVVDEMSSENAPDVIDLGNAETVVDEISSENAPDVIDLGNAETVVDEISSENAPDVIDLGNTETVVDEINPAGNTETVVDEISPENADIKHLSMDAEDQSIEVLNFENDDQTKLNNLSVVTEDQASQNSTFEDSDEPNVIKVMPDSPELKAEPILDVEVDHNLLSESNESESPLQPDEISPTISLELERKDVENTEIMEVSGHEVVEDQASEVLNNSLNSKEATSAAEELILSSGATLLQYPSKVDMKHILLLVGSG